MKILFDFFPIAAFFIAYKWQGIYLATAIAIAASLIQVLWSRYKQGRFEKIPVITFFSILILGGATLLFKNEIFIKWKPTVVYWILAIIFLGSHFVGSKKPIIQRFAGETVSLPNYVWSRINYSWCAFFFLMGIANLYVIHNFNTDTWVNFKLFGTLICTLIFIFGQAIYMYKHRSHDLKNFNNININGAKDSKNPNKAKESEDTFQS